MDPLTHGILGGVAAASIQRGKIQRPLVVAGLLGAMAPDLDFVIRSRFNPLLFFEFHRHFTHSLFFAPIGGILVGTLVWLLSRRRAPWGRMFLAAMLGFFTHDLLDTCTSYGTQLLWPISRERFAWDFISIVDPIYTLALLIGLLWSWWGRFPGAARLALLLSLVYLGMGAWQNHVGLGWQQRLAAERGQRWEQGRVMPSLGNLILWRSVYRSGDRFYVDALRMPPTWNWRLYPGGSQEAFRVDEPRPLPSPGSVLRTDLELFEWFAQGYVGVISRQPWVLGDLRLTGLPNATAPIFGFKFNPNRPGEHLQRVRFPLRTQEQLDIFWEMLKGK
jgi:Predicted membrane-bound metal-dependent hydrolases